MDDPVGPPSTVAIDLTPVLPGGDNGGAKVFALDLVSHLASERPDCQFVLLTQAASHGELAALDRSNVRRVQVIGAAASAGRAGAFGAASRLIAPLPAWVRRRIAAAGYVAFGMLKRGGSSRLLRDMGVDLLFCPFTAPTFREPGIPLVCTVYDVQYRTYPQFFSVEDAAQRDAAFLDACRHATRLAAISEYSRTSALATGAPAPGRIRTILLQRSPEMPMSVTGRMLSEDDFLLYPANFWRHKNHEMLLAAFGMACRMGLPRHLKLVCTGAPGPRRDWLMRAAATMGLASRVAFPGFVSPAEYRALLGRARGVVFASLYEGFGLPLIEAMSAGVPLACSNTTSLPEVAGEAALLFDPRVPERMAQAIVSLATDEPLRARLVEAGHRRAPAFSHPERMAAEYWHLFADALSHREDRASS